MKKRILIVTGSDYTGQVYDGFQKVLDAGHELYLLSDGSFNPRPGFFTQHFTYALRKTRETLEYMRSQTVEFDAVTIKTSEWLTPLTALLAKEFKCRGNTPLTAFHCRSKYHMRRELEKAGVPIPAFRLCRNFDELSAAIHEIGIPCVAKPVGGNASYGTFLIRHEEDLKLLRHHYEKSVAYLKKLAVDKDIFAFSPDEMELMGVKDHVDMVSDYLVEEFMSGPEISIDTLTQDGKTTVMGMADQIRMEPPFFIQLAEKMPYVCSEKTRAEIESLVSQTVSAMEIRDSAAHTELIFTKDGPKVVEIGCRIGGDNIHDAVFQTSGYNLMYESIMIALGESRNYKIPTLCHTAMQYLLPSREGTIRKIHLPTEPKRFNITEMILEACEGDRVSAPPDGFDFIGYLSVRGDTPEEAQALLQGALSEVKIEFE